MNRKVLAKICSGIGMLTVALVIVLMIPLSVPKLFGYRIYGVMTGSMEPEYGVGGVVYVRACETGELSEGDVITYLLGSDTTAVCTHRIVGITEDGAFITRGDANNTEDPQPVLPESVVGKVDYYVPFLANVVALLKSTAGILVLFCIFAFVLICWMLADLLEKGFRLDPDITDKMRRALRVLSVVMILGALGYFAYVFAQYREGSAEYEALSARVFGESDRTQDPGADAVDEQTAGGENHLSGMENKADWSDRDARIQKAVAALREENPDMIGWIAFDNLDISYPVMQGSDNDYYLHHTFSGEKNSAGSIFADAINHPDFTDSHTFLYGHNMRNRTMFGSLRNYKDPSFYIGNEYFTVYTGEKVLRYQIFSYYDVSENSDVYTVWYTPDETFEKAVGKMKSNAYYDTGVEVSAEDRIVTLSTCSAKGSRFVIHAKLTEK